MFACYGKAILLALDRHPLTILLRAKKQKLGSLARIPRPQRVVFCNCTGSASIPQILSRQGLHFVVRLRSRVPRRRRSRYDGDRCLGQHQRQFARSTTELVGKPSPSRATVRSFIIKPSSENNRGIKVSALPYSFFRMQRSRRPELMDQPGLELAEHVRALQGLGRINVLSRVGSVLWPPIERLARLRGMNDRTLRVLDLATGGGDAPITLAQRAAAKGLNVEVDGCDISPQAIHYAQGQASARGIRVKFFVLDALSERLPSDYDVLCCSLFLHHLGETDAIALLSRMAAAAQCLVLVDDLVRNRWGYLLALAGCHVLSSSRIVHVDGPTSVAAAFTPREALHLAERAGLRGTSLTRHWPQRYLLTWSVQ